MSSRIVCIGLFESFSKISDSILIATSVTDTSVRFSFVGYARLGPCADLDPSKKWDVTNTHVIQLLMDCGISPACDSCLQYFDATHSRILQINRPHSCVVKVVQQQIDSAFSRFPFAMSLCCVSHKLPLMVGYGYVCRHDVPYELISEVEEDLERFLEDMECICSALGCFTHRAMELVGFRLKDSANTWFITLKGSRPLGSLPITWEEFVQTFLDWFLPKNVKNIKA
ncbi:Uncharacterized protein TCM_023502 [Theobroma cacao]|uniref:Uncharacterized protein n=1 Tax=Theobroma cacao TaxID=3641 RepID=A0A061EVJ4_THECC|nr:Uncharacterized protein TCM_023502 [Theobroma cacao]